MLHSCSTPHICGHQKGCLYFMEMRKKHKDNPFFRPVLSASQPSRNTRNCNSRNRGRQPPQLPLSCLRLRRAVSLMSMIIERVLDLALSFLLLIFGVNCSARRPRNNASLHLQYFFNVSGRAASRDTFGTAHATHQSSRNGLRLLNLSACAATAT